MFAEGVGSMPLSRRLAAVAAIGVIVLGLVATLVMLGAILYLYVIGNADSKKEAFICFAITGAWAVLSVLYFVVTGRRRLAVAPGAVR